MDNSLAVSSGWPWPRARSMKAIDGVVSTLLSCVNPTELNMSDALAKDGAVAVSSTSATTTFVGGRYGGSCAPSTSNTGAIPIFRVRWSW